MITCTKHKSGHADIWEPSAHDTHTVRCEGIIHLTPRYTGSYDRTLGAGVVRQVGETRHGDEDPG